MAKLNTKEIDTGSRKPNKFLQPGNALCKINSVKLEEFKFKPGSYNIVLSMEGSDMGASFEGFFIDRTDESKGRFKGQIGLVKAGEWAFSDGVTKGGVEVVRDREILKFMKNLCDALGIAKWLQDQDDKHDTIESLIETFDKEKPFKEIYMEYCISGREYTSRSGYTNYELFLPKYIKGGAPFSKDKSRVIVYDENLHIKKQKVENVAEFGNDNPETPEVENTDIPKGNKDFDLG